MKTEIKIEPHKSGNLVIDVYVNDKWFKQIIPEADINKITITEVLNCVSDSLERDEDFNML